MLERWLGSTVRVLRAGTGNVMVLEGAGAMAWAALSSPGTAEDLVAAMASVAPPDMDPEQAAAVVDEALDRLVAAGLVRAAT